MHYEHLLLQPRSTKVNYQCWGSNNFPERHPEESDLMIELSDKITKNVL